MLKGISFIWALLIFCISATSRYDLTLIARIPMGELLAFASLPLLFKQTRFAPYMPRIQLVACILLLWFLGVAISDLANANYFERFIRGCLKPVFCCLWFLFYMGVLQKDYRLLLFAPLGGVVGALQNYFMPQSFTAAYISSGGYEAVAYGLSPIVTSILSAIGLWLYGKSRLYSALCFFLTAVFLGAIGAPRNYLMVSLFCSGVVTYIWWMRVFGRGAIRLSFFRLAWIGCLVLSALIALYYAYLYSATQGWLGELQLAKFEDQSNTIFGSSPLGLVLAGRPQVFGAILALVDTPLLGTGSWTAWMMTDYFYEAMAIVGTDSSMLERIAEGGIAGVGHSIVMQIWLENGILAFAAMVMILWIAIKVFLAVLERDSLITPIIVAGFVAFLWNYFFSPFDTGTRKVIGMFFAMYVLNFPTIVAYGRVMIRRPR